MPKMNAAALSEMCDRILALGGDHNHPDIVARYLPIEPAFETEIDETLDPFSDAYFDSQIALYREVAGRDLDQTVGELHDIDITPNLAAANPMAIGDVAYISEHVRVVSTMLELAALRNEPEILDMGAGHGLAAEIFAFAGCRVTAVDIDPLLSELSRRRAAARNLPIERVVLNYDDLSALPESHFEAAFFFQSLHHCLRPWDLVSQLRTKLVDGGMIAFAGEPIQSIWWRNWGLRLDAESLFVARTLGWCEMGWSRGFIRSCFEKAGFRLTFFSGGVGGGEIGIATTHTARLDKVRKRAVRMGLKEIRGSSRTDFPDTALASDCGALASVTGGRGFRQTGPQGGFLVFGPHITLPPGEYEASTVLTRSHGSLSRHAAKFEAVAEGGARRLASIHYPRWRRTAPRLLTIRFVITEETDLVELRVRVSGSQGWTAAFPTLRNIGEQSA